MSEQASAAAPPDAPSSVAGNRSGAAADSTPTPVEKMTREQIGQEIAGIEKVMQDNRTAYNRDEKMQARYRDLLRAPSDTQTADHETLLEDYISGLPVNQQGAFGKFEEALETLTGPRLGQTIDRIHHIMRYDRARYDASPSMQSLLRVLYRARDGQGERT